MSRWFVRVLFGRMFDRMADEMVTEWERLAHCHVCGGCICNQHNALSDDDWDLPRRICRRCDVARRYQSKIAAAQS